MPTTTTHDLLSLLNTALTTLCAILASAILVSAIRRAARKNKLLKLLPLAPGSKGWLAGHVPSLLARDFHSLMCRWSDELLCGGDSGSGGGAFAVALPFGDRGVVVTDPAAVAAVLGARRPGGGGRAGDERRRSSIALAAADTALPKYSPAYGVLDSLWGGSPSVFTCARRTARWRAVRKGVAPAFSVAAARGCVGGIAGAAAELCDSLLRQGEVVAAAEKVGKSGGGTGGEEGHLEEEQDRSLVVLSSSRSPSPSPSSSSAPPPPTLTITVNADALGMRLALSAVGRSTLGLDFGATRAEQRCAPVAALAVALPEAQAAMANPLRLFSKGRTARRAAAARSEFREAVLKASKSLREKAAAAAEATAGAAAAGGSSGKEKAAAAAALPAAASALASVLDPSTGKPLSAAALAAEFGTLVMGGFETTGHVLAFALLRVAACPRAQEGIERELRDAGLLSSSSSAAPPPPSSSSSSSSAPSPPPRLPSSADLKALPYLLAVAKEALRLHPTVPGVPRMTSKEITLPLSSSSSSSSDSCSSSSRSPGSPSSPSSRKNSVVIPAGTFVYALMRHAQRAELEWGSDALEFRPERWFEAEEEEGEEAEVDAQEKKRRRRRPFYAPFSLGPRDCAGKTLALVTLHATLAVVCSRFTLVEVEESYDRTVVEKKTSSSCSSSSSSPSALIDLPEEIALTAHPSRPLLKLVPR